jgi:hypothetical protein
MLVSGIDLPGNMLNWTTVINTDTCQVYHLPALAKLIGMKYAAATTLTGTDTAQVRAERTPHC